MKEVNINDLPGYQDIELEGLFNEFNREYFEKNIIPEGISEIIIKRRFELLDGTKFLLHIVYSVNLPAVKGIVDKIFLLDEADEILFQNTKNLFEIKMN